MKTVGDLLKSARQAKRIELHQIAAHTKIALKYLEAIEANHFEQLPPAAFTKGFLHTYANIVGVNPETILAMFRRDYAQDDRGRIIPRSLVNPIKTQSSGITPTKITTFSIIIIGLAMTVFFAIQIIAFTSKPKLALDQPANQVQLTSPVLVKGSTHSQNTITVNNNPVSINESGEFSTLLEFETGEHTIIIIAATRTGKKNGC
jgi:cytoskeletal protein RodZ